MRIFISLLLIAGLAALLPAQHTYVNKVVFTSKAPKAAAARLTPVPGDAYRATGAIDTGFFFLRTGADCQPIAARYYVYEDAFRQFFANNLSLRIWQYAYPNELARWSDGSFIVGGTIDSSAIETYPNGVSVGGNVRSHGLLARADAEGRLLWAKKYAGSEGRDLTFVRVLEAPDGKIVAFGAYRAPLTVDRFAAVFIFDKNGAPLSCFVDAHNDYSECTSAIRTSDGGWAFGGRLSNEGRAYQAFVWKTDANFKPLWGKTYAQVAFDRVVDLVEAPNGDLGILAYIGSIHSHMVVIRTDSKGNTIFTKRVGDNPLDTPVALRATADGDLVIAGTYGDFSQSDLLLARIDAQGETLWSRRIGNAEITNINQGEVLIYTNETAHSLILEDKRILLGGRQYALHDTIGKPKRIVFEGMFAAALGYGGESAECYTVDASMSSVDAPEINIAGDTPVFTNLPFGQQAMAMREKALAFTEDVWCAEAVSTETATGVAPLRVWPNPATHSVHIQLEPGRYRARFYNAWGALLSEKNIDGQSAVSCENFLPGLYFLSITNEKGQLVGQNTLTICPF